VNYRRFELINLEVIIVRSGFINYFDVEKLDFGRLRALLNYVAALN